MYYTCIGVCSGNGSEDSVEALSEKMELTDFVIKPGMTCMHTVFETRVISVTLSGTAIQLQGHVHWLLELAITLVSNLSSGDTTSVSHTSTHTHAHCTMYSHVLLMPCSCPSRMPWSY